MTPSSSVIALFRMVAVGICCYSGAACASTFYISPNGSDHNDGSSLQAPVKTFAKAFRTMSGGDTLILMDGQYGVGHGTGNISRFGPTGARLKDPVYPPNGLDRDHMTTIRADNDGKALLIGTLGVCAYNGSPSCTRPYLDPDAWERGARPLWLGAGGPPDNTNNPEVTRAKYIQFEGIQFVNGGAMCYVCSWIAFKRCGFESRPNYKNWNVGTGHADGIYRNPPHWRNDHYLFEDCWFSTTGRGGLEIDNTDYAVIRRCVFRIDGIDKYSGEPSVATTVYYSAHVSYQNVIVVDSLYDQYPGMQPRMAGLDFMQAEHGQYYHATTSLIPHGDVEWLGTASLNSSGAGWWPEADYITEQPFARMRNVVVYNPCGNGIANGYTGGMVICKQAYTSGAPRCDVDLANISIILPDPSRCAHPNLNVYPGAYPPLSTERASTSIANVLIWAPQDETRRSNDPAFRIFNIGRDQAETAPRYSNWSGVFRAGSFGQGGSPCGVGCSQTDAVESNPPALEYVTRVEADSFLAGTGEGGANRGADLTFRYGCDGCWFGDPGFNTPHPDQPLWPWPNQERLKSESCLDWSSGTASPVQRPVPPMTGKGVFSAESYCAASIPSFTEYVWNYMPPAGVSRPAEQRRHFPPGPLPPK
jgi:hypothetical protein